jgi:hypothetical protein
MCEVTDRKTDTTEPSTERGVVTWHSSDEDSGPDVGLSIGLGDGKLLWVGEVPDRDGWCLAIYHPLCKGGREDLASFHDAESARAFFDEMERLANHG